MMRAYLGVDVGGSSIKAVLLEAGGKRRVVKALTVSTPRTKKGFEALISAVIHDFSRSVTLSGIGVGLPGMVDTTRGILQKAPNLPFLDGWHAKKFLRRFLRNVGAENDVRCLLRAETTLGAARGKAHAIALGVGTGIGGAIFIDGSLYEGAHHSAGEFGHMLLDEGKTLEKLGAKEAFLARGDRTEAVAKGISNLINAFDPEIVVVGGGAVAERRLDFRKMRTRAGKLVMSPGAKRTPIVPARLGAFAQAIGAALLVVKK